ncbi:hypothetical protein BHM03_00006964 [Ensete ventricosum]|nr:hypothetical protein BHM03_00006964 [Ensete ventricosum]
MSLGHVTVFPDQTHNRHRLALDRDSQKSRCVDWPTVQLTMGGWRRGRTDAAPLKNPKTLKKSVLDIVKYCSNENDCCCLAPYQCRSHNAISCLHLLPPHPAPEHPAKDYRSFSLRPPWTSLTPGSWSQCILGHDIYILLRPCLQLQGPSPRQHGEIDNVSLKLLLPSHFLPSQRPSTLPPTSTILLLLLPPPEAKAACPVCKLGGIRAELNPSLVINLSLWQLPAWERGEAEPAGTELVACFLPGRSRTKAAPSFLPSDLTAPGPGVRLLTSRRFLFGGSVEV